MAHSRADRPPSRRRKVYLAGPISNCNERQIRGWREDVHSRWGEEFDLIDPAGQSEAASSPFDVVRRDLQAIQEADAVLANMWRESIGTAIGVVHAAWHGKPVFVVDPNQIRSPMLAWYSEAVVKSPNEGMRRIREHFRSLEHLRTVIKRGGTEEAFDRGKLLESVRRASRAAGQDDVLTPKEILPEVISRLVRATRTPGKGKLTSRSIREKVWEVLREMEADPLRGELFTGIRAAWDRDSPEQERPAVPHPRSSPAVMVHAQALKVRIYSRKSHTTIWGRAVRELRDIPREARRLFEEVCRIGGIAEIRLTIMSSSRTKWLEGVRAEILASKEPGIIEGKVHDKAVSGRVQMFQVLVHDTTAKEAIRLRLIEHLRERKLLRLPAVEGG